jgi:hypothetical protein
MTGIDLIVLIAWTIASVALILVCVRLQISSGRSQRPQRPAGGAQAPGVKPGGAQGPAPLDPVSAPGAETPHPVSAPGRSQESA